MNRIDIDASNIDYPSIDRQYDFYLIENHGGKFKPNARIFDESLASKNVVAVQYTSGPSFILMLKKDRMNDATVAEIIKNARDEKNDITKKKLSVPFESYPHSLIQIMFNGLAKSSKNENVSNLGGKLYYFSEKSKDGRQVFCVEVKILNGYTISLSGKTFTRTTMSTGRPEYILQANNTLKLRSKSDGAVDFYTPYQYQDTRHQVTFLDVSGISKFESSKVGILSRLLEKFKKQYGIQLKIKEENDWEKLDVKSATTQKRDHLRRIKNTLDGKKINIVNAIVGDDNAMSFCQKLKDVIERIFIDEMYFLKGDRKLNFSVEVCEKEDEGTLNFRIIHSKSYYENQKEKDAYKLYPNVPVQHITIDDFPRRSRNSKDGKRKKGDPEESACIAALNDLIVKYDLIANREKSISITDWNSYHYENDWKFYFCYEKEIETEEKKTVKENHYYLMHIEPNGCFGVREICERDAEYAQYDEIFSMNNMKAERHNRSVMDSDGNINIIQESSNFMLPSISEINDALRNEGISRKKDDLEKYFGACLDIYYHNSTEGNDELYSVGQIGSGMNTTIERSAKIRKIIPYKNSKLFFRNVLDTMNVTFVRNGQLTIMPFPFKYIREWIELNADK
jgi:hypothetical protein